MLVASGWRPGFDKVGFTKLLREHGYPLAKAVTVTGRLLEGEPVELELEGFADRCAAAAALEALGVREVRQMPMPER